jgi:Uma2 family endonuclease
MTPTVPAKPYTPTYLDDAFIGTFSTARFDRWVEEGILSAEDPFELLENHLVRKMPKNPAHDGTALRFRKRLSRVLPAGWDVREQGTLLLTDSRPEPDFAVVCENPDDYTTRHPTPADTALVVEVANTSLLRDQRDKARIYARAGIACYWIVNLDERRVEVHTGPSGPCDSPAYATVDHFAPGQTVPLVLAGTEVARVAVADLLP